ncbi:hypothetical protein KAT36_02175 [Candidatus Pacearchaeota archaeon]|nr:hypothetical protein [Candidatus Pacearchaeota archaeon]
MKKKVEKVEKVEKVKTSLKQRVAAMKNIKKAQAKWKGMTKAEHAAAQPEGRARERPGAGGGEFFRVVVRPKTEFKTFRAHDVGKKGHVERLAGQRANGSWDTQAWLISKKEADVVGGVLMGKSKDVRDVLAKLQSEPKQFRGDIFKAKPRRNVPEEEKPTPAMKKAQMRNIKKAQAARWKK